MAELQERRRSLQALLSTRLAELRRICLQEAVSDVGRPITAGGALVRQACVTLLSLALSLVRS